MIRNSSPAARSLYGWASVLILSSVLLLLGLARPALAQDTCTGSTAVSGFTDAEYGLIDDCTTLLGLKGTLEGSGFRKLDWAEDMPMSSWEYITVSKDDPPRVTRLEITGQMSGSIPAKETCTHSGPGTTPCSTQAGLLRADNHKILRAFFPFNNSRGAGPGKI